MKKHLLLILILIILALPAIAALFHPGFFQSDDGEWMVIRFSAFHQAFRDGQFPVRFLDRLNYGYGYPVANFLYPGFMYLGEVIKLLGFGFVSTIKITLGLSMVGSAVFAYLWLSKLFNKWSAFVAALIYLYAPYHLYDLYTRGSVGEILALGIVPFVFWQIERKSFFWVSLGIGALILSHNSIALLFIPLIFLYLLFRGLAQTIYFSAAIILGIGLSSFFSLPAVFDLKYTIFNQTQVSNWSNYFANFNLIGVLPILLFLLYPFKIFVPKDRISNLMFFVGLLFLFLSLPVSLFVWKFLPVSFIQFPFRLLSIVIVSSSFMAALLLNRIKGSKSFLLVGVLLMIGLASSFSYLTPQAFFDKGDQYYATNEGTTTVKNEYMPIWVKNLPVSRPQAKVENLNGQEKINLMQTSSKKTAFNVYLAAPRVIQVNTVYFPGWTASVNGMPKKIKYERNGLIQLDLNQGENNVLLTFGETPLRLFADLISAASLVLIILVSLSCEWVRRKFT